MKIPKKKKDNRDHRGRVDKIRNNNWNNVDIDTSKITFNTSTLTDDYDIINSIDQENIELQIDSILKSNEYFKRVLASTHKIKKLDVNEMYNLIISKINTDVYELFKAFANYLSIEQLDLLDTLSNVFKDSIIIPLSSEYNFFNLNNDLH